MSKYEIFNNGIVWTVLSTNENGAPFGSALGSFESKEKADQRVSEMLADEGVHIGTLTHRRSGFKLILGGKKWVAWYSNAMMDLQKEFFPIAATDQYIARVDSKQIPLPGLWWFHVKGTQHGQAELLGRIGLLTLAVGGFDDSTIAEKFKTYYRDHKQELSHGFWYDPRKFKGGAYNYYNTFEISTLPPGNAANPFTSFEVFDMFDETKLKQLASIIGDHDAEVIATQTAKTSKQLLDLGVKFKAMGTPTDDEETEESEDMPMKKKKNTPTPAPAASTPDVEARIADGFKSITDQLAGVLTPLAGVLTTNQKAQAELTAKVDQLESAVKTLATFIRDEFAMQPPATNNPATLLNGNDPAAQFMQFMQQQAGNNGGLPQQGSKGNNPLGPFAEVFGAMGLAGKSMQQSPFEVPGAFGSQQAMQQQPGAMPQQPPAQQPGAMLPQQPPPQASNGMNMQQFVESLLPNHQPGVGIPRLGQ